MSDKKWRTWEVLGLLFVLAAGNLLHFVYDWTGQSPVVGALAAVNESVWEHMKLLTTPWVLWSIAELVAVGRSGLPVTAARAAGLLAGPAARCWRRCGRRLLCGPSHRRSCRCSWTRRPGCGASGSVLPRRLPA